MSEQDITIFEFLQPAQIRVPFLFNSPHSGRFYPKKFLDLIQLNHFDIRLSEDSYVDLLFNDVVRLGCCFMAACFPRAFVDLNRAADEIDPEMFSESFPNQLFTPTQRVMAGLGIIPRIVTTNMNIYKEKLSLQEAFNRIENYYIPYHKALDAQLKIIRQQFGYSVLIDCHSMPSKLKFFGGTPQPDFILGDRYGRTCSYELCEHAADILRSKGYVVAINRPYSGGFITTHYGRPEEGSHALQLEINRSLYLNEISLEITSGFSQLKSDLNSFAADLVSLPDSAFNVFHNAAE